jgi:pimeloyl-ACP methyl ester carboxylesterase
MPLSCATQQGCIFGRSFRKRATMKKAELKIRNLLALCVSISCFAACTKVHTTTEVVQSPGKSIAGYIRSRVMMGNPVGPDEVIDPDAATREQNCKDFQSQNNFDIKDYIEVPENPDDPEGRKIKVYYYGKIRSGKTPVVFFNGGPGSSSWSSHDQISVSQWDMDPSFSLGFIYIDQRGTGCSDPYPEGDDPDTLQRLTHYGSKGIVADAEAIRKKLLLDQPWKVFGQSYGAFIVHRYMVDAPQGIFSAHAHANAINSDPVERFANRIYSQQRVLERYFQQYPNDRKIIENLRSLLTKDYCMQDETTKLKDCGYNLLTSLISLLGFQPDWKALHRWLNQIWTEDGLNLDSLKRFESLYHFPDMADEEGFKVADAVIAVTDRSVSATCAQVSERLKNRGVDAQNILLNECMGDFQVPPDLSSNLDNDPRILQLPRSPLTIASFKEALEKNPNVPFYLYSGDLDTFVPQENFTEETQEVGSLIHYTNFMGTGHDGFYTEPLVWNNLIK